MASALPLQEPSTSLNHFLVRSDGRGHWTVRDERNLVGGTFVSEDAAIRFARRESNGLPGAVIRR